MFELSVTQKFVTFANFMSSLSKLGHDPTLGKFSQFAFLDCQLPSQLCGLRVERNMSIVT
jgi:hypothetical protein